MRGPGAHKGNLFIVHDPRLSKCHDYDSCLHICDAQTPFFLCILGSISSVQNLGMMWSCIFASDRAVDLYLRKQTNLGRTALITILVCIKTWIPDLLGLAMLTIFQLNHTNDFNNVSFMICWLILWMLSYHASNMVTINRECACLCLHWLLWRINTNRACELNWLDFENWDVCQTRFRVNRGYCWSWSVLQRRLPCSVPWPRFARSGLVCNTFCFVLAVGVAFLFLHAKHDCFMKLVRADLWRPKI